MAPHRNIDFLANSQNILKLPHSEHILQIRSLQPLKDETCPKCRLQTTWRHIESTLFGQNIDFLANSQNTFLYFPHCEYIFQIRSPRQLKDETCPKCRLQTTWRHIESTLFGQNIDFLAKSQNTFLYFHTVSIYSKLELPNVKTTMGVLK